MSSNHLITTRALVSLYRTAKMLQFHPAKLCGLRGELLFYHVHRFQPLAVLELLTAAFDLPVANSDGAVTHCGTWALLCRAGQAGAEA